MPKQKTFIYDAGTQALIADLEAKPRSFDRDEIIRAVKRGKYHDYKSPLDLPKVELARRLKSVGYVDLMGLAMDGKYDQGADAASEWEEQQLGPDGNPELAAIIRTLKDG